MIDPAALEEYAQMLMETPPVHEYAFVDRNGDEHRLDPMAFMRWAEQNGGRKIFEPRRTPDQCIVKYFDLNQLISVPCCMSVLLEWEGYPII